MKIAEKLPEGYREIFSVNLQTDKKIALLVNGLALGIAAVLAVPAHFVVPITTLFRMDDGIGVYFLRFLVLILGSIAYIVLHEAVHGVAI